jgi:hypothetical protein
MAHRTVDDLRELRAKLVERRREEAYWIASEHHESIEKFVQVHLAIEAVDAVIATGAGEPERSRDKRRS